MQDSKNNIIMATEAILNRNNSISSNMSPGFHNSSSDDDSFKAKQFPNNSSTKSSSRPRPRRKAAHNAIEKRYRNNINDRILELRSVVPALNSSKSRDPRGSKKRNNSIDSDIESDSDPEAEICDGVKAAKKLSKASILRKSAEYIVHLKTTVSLLEYENFKLRSYLSTDNINSYSNFLVSLDQYLLNEEHRICDQYKLDGFECSPIQTINEGRITLLNANTKLNKSFFLIGCFNKNNSSNNPFFFEKSHSGSISPEIHFDYNSIRGGSEEPAISNCGTNAPTESSICLDSTSPILMADVKDNATIFPSPNSVNGNNHNHNNSQFNSYDFNISNTSLNHPYQNPQCLQPQIQGSSREQLAPSTILHSRNSSINMNYVIDNTSHLSMNSIPDIKPQLSVNILPNMNSNMHSNVPNSAPIGMIPHQMDFNRLSSTTSSLQPLSAPLSNIMNSENQRLSGNNSNYLLPNVAVDLGFSDTSLLLFNQQFAQYNMIHDASSQSVNSNGAKRGSQSSLSSDDMSRNQSLKLFSMLFFTACILHAPSPFNSESATMSVDVKSQSINYLSLFNLSSTSVNYSELLDIVFQLLRLIIFLSTTIYFISSLKLSFFKSKSNVGLREAQATLHALELLTSIKNEVNSDQYKEKEDDNSENIIMRLLSKLDTYNSDSSDLESEISSDSLESSDINVSQNNSITFDSVAQQLINFGVHIPNAIYGGAIGAASKLSGNAQLSGAKLLFDSLLGDSPDLLSELVAISVTDKISRTFKSLKNFIVPYSRRSQTANGYSACMALLWLHLLELDLSQEDIKQKEGLDHSIFSRKMLLALRMIRLIEKAGNSINEVAISYSGILIAMELKSASTSLLLSDKSEQNSKGYRTVRTISNFVSNKADLFWKQAISSFQSLDAKHDGKNTSVNIVRYYNELKYLVDLQSLSLNENNPDRVNDYFKNSDWVECQYDKTSIEVFSLNNGYLRSPILKWITIYQLKHLEDTISSVPALFSLVTDTSDVEKVLLGNETLVDFEMEIGEDSHITVAKSICDNIKKIDTYKNHFNNDANLMESILPSLSILSYSLICMRDNSDLNTCSNIGLKSLNSIIDLIGEHENMNIITKRLASLISSMNLIKSLETINNENGDFNLLNNLSKKLFHNLEKEQLIKYDEDFTESSIMNHINNIVIILEFSCLSFLLNKINLLSNNKLPISLKSNVENHLKYLAESQLHYFDDDLKLILKESIKFN